MKRLLELLKSERSLGCRRIRGLSDHFGWNRAVARIIGFFLFGERRIGSELLPGMPGGSAS